MSFLERAIRRGVSDAVGKAIGQAVQQAVEPTATRMANEAAASLDRAAGQAQTQATGLEGALGNLQRSMGGYASQAAQNLKICPSCGRPAQADRKFCADCGTKLPETTLGQGALCPACGTQNTVGTRFCSACGTKLPAALEEEAQAQARSQEVMAKWDTMLAPYPRWACGGMPVDIECLGPGEYMFTVDFRGDSSAARQAVYSYLDLVRQQGFRPAGMYPSNDNLYNRIGGTCYYIDTEHAFDGDSDCPTIGFAVREPAGGFDYVKPEPRKKTSIFDLFK